MILQVVSRLPDFYRFSQKMQYKNLSLIPPPKTQFSSFNTLNNAKLYPHFFHSNKITDPALLCNVLIINECLWKNRIPLDSG